MNGKKILAAIEAILFAAAEPIDCAKIAEVLEISVEDTKELLSNLAAKLEERDSGVCLLRLETKYQLCSRKEFENEVRATLEIKRDTPLSQAAFEVLAIVAYNQPITKSYIDQIRGVECAGVISTLCQKGLIEEKGRLDLPGRPILYGTTTNFLRCFSLTTLKDLPQLPEGDTSVLMTDSDSDIGQLKTEFLKTRE